MENNTQNHPTHQDRYETNISGGINQLSIGQLLKYKLEDGCNFSAMSDCTKQDMHGQYNTKIKLNVPKQEQPPTIVFNFPTKNNGTVLQLDPRTTREFLSSGRLPNLANGANVIPSPPLEALAHVKLIQDTLYNKDIDCENMLRETTNKKQTCMDISTEKDESPMVPTISFDVEEDGQGNQVIGITFPNTNLSSRDGMRRNWRKWLLPLKIGAMVVLIILIIIIHENHLRSMESREQTSV
jgi:hypothetical protein